ncbi:drug resistance transporter, EmrB/QacA subfamily [Beutenbergia cavernae DSM 12333]|uniref:Drug resistance transporter, EmrB/QacA subfamily n=1 Tax=Beutenbergia cavernae (strain ATCC BAA-8 / DSM 12333 / CCUG 43141 / JCM 11478 / NBRC 16432 / NCIMB 13614 / HKI 0122) TaxID=471853 RepID=C5BX54_BEUC1|nr:MDR family MFS transporter [Beutenbergia cavernae]ACQ78729.1 drug resistance transporter, EmrB/QacA subfamily [Beutenbergia cavernae DSM 12333]
MTATTASTAPTTDTDSDAEHKQILRVLVGLLLALFVAMLSGTIVANALPVIIAELDGTQQQYTWVVTATLLASTAVTPLFGKLADLYDKKKLLLIGIGIFAVGSLLSGLSTSAGMLIGFRVIQGVGLGALQALVQITIATIISPRQRGRYAGYMGAVMAFATVSGPLLGGLIVDVSWLGWRWCYWSAIPLALIAMVVLARRLHVPPPSRTEVKVDWLGATLISAAVTLLLLWVSFAGPTHSYDWISWQTAVMVPGALALFGLFIWVESRVAEPIVPLWILRERTTTLAIVASIAVGVGMFGASVFLGQYFQIARGYSPTEAGLLTIPMMLGLLVSSTVSGRFVTQIGRWKPFVVWGLVTFTAGMGLLGSIQYGTSLWLIGVFMLVAGIGLGASMQNLVLAVQNTVPLSDMGAATSSITFFRSLGGAMGVQVLGAVFASHVSSLTATRLTDAGIPVAPGGDGGGSLDLSELPDAVADIIRSAYGDSIGLLFLIGAGLALVGLVAALFMRGTHLRDTVDLKAAVAEAAEEDVAVETAAATALGAAVAVDETADQTADETADAVDDADGVTAGARSTT